MNVVKQIFIYLKGIADDGRFFRKGNNIELKAFVDTNWAGDTELRRLTNGYLLKIGNSLTPWCGRRQSMVALSSDEPKYHTLMENTKKVVWLRKLLTKLDL